VSVEKCHIENCDFRGVDDKCEDPYGTGSASGCPRNLQAALAESERKYAKLEKAVAMSIDRRWIIEYEDYDLIGWVVYEEDGEGIVPTTPEERYEEPAAALLAAFDEAHKDGRTEENME